MNKKNFTNKKYLESGDFNVNLKSKEDLIETLLLALDNQIRPIKYSFSDKVKLSKSVFDGGYLVSNFIGNENLEIAEFEDELDFPLLDINTRDFKMPLFHLHSDEHAPIFESLMRLAGKGNIIDVLATSFRSSAKRKRYIKDPVVDFDLSLFRDDLNWYGHRVAYNVGRKNKSYVLDQIKRDNEESINKHKNDIRYLKSNEKVNSLLQVIDEERKKDGLEPVGGQIFNEDGLIGPTIKYSSSEEFKFPYLYAFSAYDPYIRQNKKRYNFTVSKYLQQHLSVYLNAFYLWHIYIKSIDNRLGFQIPFLFDELESIYSLREMPKTKTGRNKKIIHWVCGHTRNIKIKDAQGDEIGEREIWIRRFLRGENKFSWNGVVVGIMPSRYDLKRHQGIKRKFSISSIR